PQNDVTLKMPAFEWVHVQLHQQKGMISLSPPTICNSACLSSKRNSSPSKVINTNGPSGLEVRELSIFKVILQPLDRTHETSN
ncbi:hypothetical protein ACWJPY_27560, partial [Klebsiella pneumoniae]